MIGTIIVNSNNPVLSQIDLPVSWDDVNVDYTTTDFGGAASSLVQDPTNATNNVNGISVAKPDGVPNVVPAQVCEPAVLST